MTDYVLIDIVQGETLFREFRLTDVDRLPISAAGTTKIVKAASPLLVADFAFVAGAGTGELNLKAVDTATAGWPPGTYDVQLWLDWGAGVPLQFEKIVDLKIAVKGALS